jgi:4-amino-4-deoxy-L-arabinose transferase-like glycosyltransferase
LLAPWERWDVHQYISIVTQGYRFDNGTAQFHPLFAWLATPIAWLSGSPTLGLLLVSSLASAALVVAFERLARYDLSPFDASNSVLLLLVAPPAFILFAPYTEALFLLCAVLCFLAARQQRWWLAGLAAGLATLTRQQGLFLALPLAWELWEAAGRNWRRACAGWRNWLALAVIPLSMLGWLTYRALALSDLNPDTSSFQSFIFSVMISPSSSQVVPQQAFLPPWEAFWLALTALPHASDQYALAQILDLTLGMGFLIILALAWPRLRISYRIYAGVVALVSFSYYTGPELPYMGLPRHLLLAFPVFIGLGPLVRHPWVRRPLVIVGLLSMFFLLLQYTIRGWVP